MLPTPKKFFLTAAGSEGNNELNAFDNALMKARIGNINLIRVTSILPPSAEYAPDLQIPPGSLVPTAYGYIISEVPGELIAAAVGVGFSEAFLRDNAQVDRQSVCGAQQKGDLNEAGTDDNQVLHSLHEFGAGGVIMEYAGKCNREEARKKVEEMLVEAFAVRKIKLADMKIVAVEHRVEKIGCVLAAVPMWY